MALESLRKCKTFWYILFLPILYFLIQFWKWLKTYFRRNFKKCIRIGQIIYRWKATKNVKLFHVDGFSESQPFSSNFKNGEITRSAFIAKQILRKCTAWRTWTSRHVYFNFTLFFMHFFSRSSPSTHRNWASDIPMESCCKHATFPCWSFFHTREQF